MQKLTQLPNGLRIVTKKLKDRQSASVGVWVAAGGRYEGDANKGVAHFLEHMAFKGSAKYSCDEIKQKVEGVGGNLNAFTGEEETCFYAKTPRRHLDSTFDVLADITLFPKIAHRDLEKERTVILEEIKMYLDLPQYYVMDVLEEMLWPAHPLGKNLAGSPETVSAMSPKDLKAFHRSFYVPSRIVVSACGDIDHDHIVELTRKRLGSLNASTGVIKYVPARKDQSRPMAKIIHKNTEQMHVALGYLAYETNHPDYYVMALLSILLGGNMSSRLFNEVREKRGLAYSISSGVKSLDDTGVFMIRAGVDNQKIEDAIALILQVLKRIAQSDVGADELKRAKDYYIGQFTLGLEDTMDHMIWVGGCLISRERVKTVSEIVGRIEKVSAKDLKRVAQYVLNPQRVNLALIGPVQEAQRNNIHKLIGFAIDNEGQIQ